MNRLRWRRIPALAWRESRTARRRLLLYMSSISLGVAALVAIDSFSENISTAVREQSRGLLGADLSFGSRTPFPTAFDSLLDSLRAEGAEMARVTTLASMAVIPRSGATRLAQVRAVEPGYPYYGEILTSPAGRWDELHDGAHAFVDPSLLVSLDARVGDTLSLGLARFEIIGAVTGVPGDAGVASAIAPRVFIPARYLAETGLLVFGSRADYDVLVRTPPTIDPDELVETLDERLDSLRIGSQTVAETEQDLTSAIAQLADFLAIVGLVALLLGGIGVGSGVHAYITKKIDTAAVLRCVGATSGQVLAIYGLQAAVMGLVGAGAGAVIGILIQFAVPPAIGPFLPVDVTPALVPGAVVLGLLIGVWVAVIFALRPILALREVSPLQALRRDAPGVERPAGWRDWRRLALRAAIAASVLVIALGRSGSIVEGIWTAVAIAIVVAVLWIAATALSRLAKRAVRRRWSFALRQGVANLYRPANQTRSVVLALGFGVFLIGTIFQLQHSLLEHLGSALRASGANLVFFDVQEDQHPVVDSLIREGGHTIVQTAPIIPMRIASVDGRPVAELMGDTTRDGGRWALRREYRSSYRDSLVSSERLLEGEWFDAADTIPEVSLEREIAMEIGVDIGGTITWDVQGVQVPTRVTSIREVDWARFEPNFFAVLEPEALRGAPRQFVILAQVPGDTAIVRLQRRVVATAPNVSSLDLTLIQETVGTVLRRVTVAIRFIALFSIAIGIPVLFSAVAASRRERIREGVLLKTLGATRAQIRRILAAEYALLGLLGALTGVALSYAAAWALTRWIFETPFTPALIPAAVLTGGMIALAVAIGLATGRDVFSETPMAALRET